MAFRPVSTDSIRLSDETARILAEELFSDPVRGRRPSSTPSPPRDTSAGAAPDSGSSERFRILRRIARGGMGVVYEAEQTSPHRIVALKVIRADHAGDDLLHRFRREAESLARLRHPGIAQIYDAGAMDTPAGPQPYLAMEMIHGEPITRHADGLALKPNERIDLFLGVCDAVEHMHESGVVHRDLKPDNILVNSRGEPRIIDFGVAMFVGAPDSTMNTEFGRLLGTMPYMSPEQVAGDPAGVDERTDVYALGVILYELLAGRLPHDLDRRRIHESLRAIREDEPLRLSAVNRLFRGDLETIVGKALEKDPDRRYQSASDLAADLRRHLANQPVTARRPSAGYRAAKFIRRHRAFVAITGIVMVLLSGGVVATSLQAAAADRARAQAEESANEASRQSERAEAVTEFLKSMLIAPDPGKDGRDVRVVDALERAEADIAGKFAEHPELEADVREALGAVYHGLGLYEESREEFERSLELLRGLRPAGDLVVVNAMHNYATILLELEQYEQAEAIMRDVVDRFTAELGAADETTMRSRSMLGMILLRRRQTQEAADLLRDLLETQRQVLGADNPDTLNTLNSWAGALTLLGKNEEATTARREMADIALRRFGEDHPHTLAARFNLARLIQRQGGDDEAAAIYDDLMPRYQRAMGPEHPLTLTVARSRAHTLSLLGRTEDTETAYGATLAAHQSALGEAHPDTISVAVYWAVWLHKAGRSAEALPLLAEAVANSSRMNPDDQALAAHAHLQYGRVLIALNRANEALAPLRFAHTTSLALYGQEHERAKAAETALAACLQGQAAPDPEQRPGPEPEPEPAAVTFPSPPNPQ